MSRIDEFIDDVATLPPQCSKVLVFFRRLGKGSWRTVGDIAVSIGLPEQSVSARIRDLRKPVFGGYKIEKRRRRGTTKYEYRIVGQAGDGVVLGSSREELVATLLEIGGNKPTILRGIIWDLAYKVKINHLEKLTTEAKAELTDD